jgi:hypothetical protein
VRRFVRFVAEKIHAVGTTPQHRWHGGILPHASDVA